MRAERQRGSNERLPIAKHPMKTAHQLAFIQDRYIKPLKSSQVPRTDAEETYRLIHPLTRLADATGSWVHSPLGKDVTDGRLDEQTVISKVDQLE